MVQSWQTDPHTVPVFCYTPCMFLHGCGWAHPVEQLELLAVLLDHLSPWFCVSSKHATQHHKVGSSPKSLGYITRAGTASILHRYISYTFRYCRKPDVWGIKLKNSVGTLYIKILYGLNCVPTCMNNLIWQYPFKIADNFTEYLFCLYCPKLTISSVINVTPRHSLPTCVTSIHSLPTCVTPVHSLSTCVLYVQI